MGAVQDHSVGSRTHNFYAKALATISKRSQDHGRVGQDHGRVGRFH